MLFTDSVTALVTLGLVQFSILLTFWSLFFCSAFPPFQWQLSSDAIVGKLVENSLDTLDDELTCVSIDLKLSKSQFVHDFGIYSFHLQCFLSLFDRSLMICWVYAREQKKIWRKIMREREKERWIANIEVTQNQMKCCHNHYFNNLNGEKPTTNILIRIEKFCCVFPRLR